jgi:hypothetical protein
LCTYPRLITGVRVDWVAAEIDRLESRIDETFLITLFQIMIENPRMTAYEVMTRAQEKSMLSLTGL